MERDKVSSGNALTRRDFLKWSAMVASVPLLAACAPSAPSPAPATSAPGSSAGSATAAPGAAPTQPASAIKRGGTLISTAIWTYPTMDPHISTMGGGLIGAGAMFNNLVRLELVDAKSWTHKLVGDLAESWEQPDLKTIVFKLKSGVTFHDGSPFNAEVAAWNILRTRDHPKSFLKGQMSNVDSVEAVDKDTVRVKLKAPNAGFLRGLGFVETTVPMISKAAVDKLGDEGFARNPVGTGPFKFKQWITDDRLVMERNSEYFEKGADGKPLPYLDGFISRYVPDPSVALVDMRAGTAHLLERVAAKDAADAKNDPNLVTYQLPWAGDVYFYGGFNLKKAPFDNVKVRQAVQYAIDREGMAKALGFGIATPYYYGEWAKGALGYDESILRYEYNPDKVKQLLKEAGYPDGISLELKVIAREPESTIGEYVQQMWTAVGIKTKLVSMERLSWIDAVRSMNFDTCFWRGSFAYTGVDASTASQRIATGAAANWSQFSDADIDRLLKDGMATADAKQRNDIYRQVLQTLQEKSLVYSGMAMPMIHLARKEVQGLSFNFSLPSLRTAWLQ